MRCHTVRFASSITLPVRIVDYVKSVTSARERVMSKVIGFTIFNSKTGQKLATLPLTIPIGATVEAYERDGHSVRWGWEESNE